MSGTVRRLRLVWHRRGDLRVQDNDLYPASSSEEKVLSLYVLDPQEFEPRPTARGGYSVTTGPHAARVLIDALVEMRQNLRDLGGDLVIRRGDPLQIVPALVEDLGVDCVIWSEYPGYYERDISEQMKKKLILLASQPRLETVSSYTLFHPDDLPYDQDTWLALSRPKEKRKRNKAKQEKQQHPSDDSAASPHYLVNVHPERWTGMPQIMGDFRRAARTHRPVRACRDEISTCDIFVGPLVEPGTMVTLSEMTKQLEECSFLGLPGSLSTELIQAANSRPSIGGEKAAHERLRYFLSNNRVAQANRNLADVVTDDQSARLSAYLAVGVLSPRQVYHASRDIPGAEWLVSHMEMRDFFVYYSYLADKQAFSLHGRLQNCTQDSIPWKRVEENHDIFMRWATGSTGLPLVDAGMLELLQTGYCSNRVRQNAASFLAKDLHLDWRSGAEWFQICLEDHCVAANYGNWAYFSGTGTDPKNRHFRTISQAARYDPQGKYVQKMIPALRNATNIEEMLRPWIALPSWTPLLVDEDSQYTWSDKQKLQETGRLSY